MKSYTGLAVKLLLVNTVLVSLAVMQWVMDINLIYNKETEALLKGCFIILQVLIGLVYLLAILTEITSIKLLIAQLLNRKEGDEVTE